MSELSHQDWKPVTLHRTYTADEKLKNAQRTGQTTSVNKNTGQNKSAKLDSETENFTIVKSGLTLGKEIQQGRSAKKLTQKQLATMLNEKPQVIQQYENGQAIPNPQIINKLQKSLGVKLSRPKKQ
jgi:putative transcription factor